jgi:hypothetical protein
MTIRLFTRLEVIFGQTLAAGPLRPSRSSSARFPNRRREDLRPAHPRLSSDYCDPHIPIRNADRQPRWMSSTEQATAGRRNGHGHLLSNTSVEAFSYRLVESAAALPAPCCICSFFQDEGDRGSMTFVVIPLHGLVPASTGDQTCINDLFMCDPGLALHRNGTVALTNGRRSLRSSPNEEDPETFACTAGPQVLTGFMLTLI